MAFTEPAFSKNEVNRAGRILAGHQEASEQEKAHAETVLANWRAAHSYPINTFQSLLRTKLRAFDSRSLAAQRLKRAPSILLKLQRFPTMNLSQMQDIGGLRAVMSSNLRVHQLADSYRNAKFKHQLVQTKDYIQTPKEDGYRSLHLIYRYRSAVAPAYNGLLLELQIRTRLQHAWATAVETMGTFLGQALKSGHGTHSWKQFFVAAGAALAIREGASPVPGYENHSAAQVFKEVADAEKRLKVLNKLQSFAIATDRINRERGSGAYHLIVLDSNARAVFIKPYPIARLDEANLEYARIEQRAKQGVHLEAVLVSAGPVEALRKAYPNYFLDTQEFVMALRRMIHRANAKAPSRSKLQEIIKNQPTKTKNVVVKRKRKSS